MELSLFAPFQIRAASAFGVVFVAIVLVVIIILIYIFIRRRLS